MLSAWTPMDRGRLTNLLQVLVVVSPRSASSSWTTRADLSSATSRALVRHARPFLCESRTYETPHYRNRETNMLSSPLKTVREDDILCLLESEREARRLR